MFFFFFSFSFPSFYLTLRHIFHMRDKANNESTNIKQRANMVVPLALNDIIILLGLKGCKRKSSTISPKADVVGVSALIVFLLAI